MIFDFDGTLANTFPWFLTIADQVADAFKLERIDQVKLEHLRDLEITKVLQYLDIPLWRLASIAAYVRRLMNRDIQNIPLFEGVDRLIQALLDKDIQVALVSSNSTKNVRKVLGLEIADQIHFYECGVSLFAKKSKFLKILASSGVSSHETIAIGDEIRDLKAAQDARIPFGAVSWGYTSVDTLLSLAPSEVFTSVEEIYEKVIRGPSNPSLQPQ